MERAIYDRMCEIQTDHWWFKGRRRIVGGVLDKLGLPKNAAILEAGCGPGGNIPLLQRYGAVTALEPDEISRRNVKERYGVAVDPGFLPHDLPYGPESFDLVCAFDVIEHVDDDAGAVKALAGLVKPGGAMLTTVPAYGWMWSRHDELHHHKRRYSLAPYRRLFEDAGLTVEKATHFNSLLFPVAFAQRRVKEALKIESADDDMPPTWLNGLLTGVFSLEAPVVAAGSAPFGLSILVAARKGGNA